ncbi:MAG: purine-nucleoside phosphorylase [Eubacteriales bacterium]|nr:purine-nucleoside phosphorylase [Eubacteriales bacterium]
MDNIYELACEAAAYISTRLPCKPDIALILGSGLGNIAGKIENKVEINYKDIPNFPTSTVKGHEGKIIAGILGGKCVIAMKGRAHYYEGYELWQVTFPIRVFKLMNVGNLIVTNSSGGINRNFKSGDLMLIRDHIGLFAPSVLRGPNDERFGVRFPDMSKVYDPGLLRLARDVAKRIGADIREGVYTFLQGPMYETPSEIKMLEMFGTDAVGMSTVPESTAAAHCGMKVLGISCITNSATSTHKTPLSHEEVLAAAKAAEKVFTEYAIAIISAMEVKDSLTET